MATGSEEFDPVFGSPVACETCGEPTHMTATKRCNRCWEIESRLEGYLRDGGVKARRIVTAILSHVPAPKRELPRCSECGCAGYDGRGLIMHYSYCSRADT